MGNPTIPSDAKERLWEAAKTATSGAAAAAYRHALQIIELPGESFATRVCPECGSDNVDATCWIDINTGVVSSTEGPLESMYCNGCGECIYGTLDKDVWEQCDDRRR